MSLTLIVQSTMPPVTKAEVRPPAAAPVSSAPTPPPAAAQGNVDLSVTALDTAAVVTDSQTLMISGALGATINNLGSDAVNAAFRVIAFEDRNSNGAFNQGTDLLLGSTDFPGGVAANASTNLNIALSGIVTFKGNLIYVFVDSQNAIVETNENNNIRHTGQNSNTLPPAGQFNPVLKWSWTGSNVEPGYKQVLVTPIVANLNDDNGDGRVDAMDIPDIVFGTMSRTDGTACEAPGILRAISGRDGSPLFNITDPAYRSRPCSPVAIGDLNGDGRPEIVAVLPDKLAIFGNDGSFKFFSDAVTTGVVGGPAIADIDHDGLPEIIYGGTVMDRNGGVRFSYPDTGNDGFGTFSVAADLDLDSNLEIVTGFRAYRSNGTVY